MAGGRVTIHIKISIITGWKRKKSRKFHFVVGGSESVVKNEKSSHLHGFLSIQSKTMGQGTFNENYHTKLVVTHFITVLTYLLPTWIFGLPLIPLLIHLCPSCVGTGPYWKCFFLPIVTRVTDTMYSTLVHGKNDIYSFDD